MNRNKPNIGVTGPDQGGTAAWWFTCFAVWLHGGRAIRLQPGNEDFSVNLHGLIIGGGADISPERYGEERLQDLFGDDGETTGFRQWIHKIVTVIFFPFIFLLRKILSTKESAVDQRRDEMEFRLMEQAIEKDLPILGICRGAQLINIQFGGNLYQDITNFYSEVPKVHSVFPKKKVVIADNSKLHKILQFERVFVNALHNQAVNRLGDRLQIAATEENGVTQAIEHQDYSFLLGVQWHPEYLPQIPAQRRLFKTLVEEAKAVMESTG